MDLQKKIDQTEEHGTLVLEFNEYFGQVVIDKPMTIDGQESTICAKTGPVLSVRSEGVSLRNVRLEVTSIPLGGESGLALLVGKEISVDLEKVVVRGDVSGIVKEDGPWEHLDVLNLRPLVPKKKNYFVFDMSVPVSCVLETDIRELKIVDRGPAPGLNKVRLEVDPLKEEAILFGQIRIKSPYLTRIISVSGCSLGELPADVGEPDKAKPVCLYDISKQTAMPTSPKPSSDPPKTKGWLKWGFALAFIMVMAVASLLFFKPKEPEQAKDDVSKPVSETSEAPRGPTKDVEPEKETVEPADVQIAEDAHKPGKNGDQPVSEPVGKDAGKPTKDAEQVPKDTSKPYGELARIRNHYKSGETISGVAKGYDDRNLKLMTFIVRHSPVKETWTVSGRSSSQDFSFSTTGWKIGTYRYSFRIEDEAGNARKYPGSFILTQPPGILDVTTNPSGATVLLNTGVFMEETPLSALLDEGEHKGNTPLQLTLDPGIYELTLKKDGYHDVVVEVEVDDEARTIPFQVELVKSN